MKVRHIPGTLERAVSGVKALAEALGLNLALPTPALWPGASVSHSGSLFPHLEITIIPVDRVSVAGQALA